MRLNDPATLTIEQFAEIDRACTRFERQWKENCQPRIEDFLNEAPPGLAERLLLELLLIERHHRGLRGEAAGSAEYLARFPGAAELIEEAFAAESPSGPPPASETSGSVHLPPRYQPVAEIARGGMGVVWRVIDRQFDRPLAVKVMLEKLAGDRGSALRFEREAQLTGSLQHPAIPPVVDRGTLADGSPFFSMKLVQGETLAGLLARRKPADAAHRPDDLPRLLGIFEQVCQAVGYAHSQGVIHRDLKPANVMVGAFGAVQVMDWGMAKATGGMCRQSVPLESGMERRGVPKENGDTPAAPLDATVSLAGSSHTGDGLTVAGTVMGTPGYMPPEQARGEVESLDGQSDVFGLGAILCEILTGRRPYLGENVWRQAAEADLGEAFAELDKCRMDAELIDLCRRCLAKEPADRPTDASSVAEEILRYQETVQQRLEQEKIDRAAAEAGAAAERSRRRVLAVLAAAVLMLVISVGGGGWWYAQDHIAKQTAAEVNSQNAEREIRDLLARSAELRDNYDFDTARALLAQAQGRTGGLLAPDELSAEIAQAEKDLIVVERLDAIRLRKSAWTNEGFDVQFARGRDGAYAETLREYGIEIVGGEPSELAGSQVAASNVSEALLGALDDWAVDDRELRDRVLSVARAADDDPLRQRSRDPAIWSDRKALLELARDADIVALEPATLVMLGRRLELAGEATAAVDLLTRAALLHPRDFWLQFHCAWILSRGSQPRSDEAIGYYRAAISARPGNVAAHNNLANLLQEAGRVEEAEAAYRKATELDPKHARAHNNLGILLKEAGRLEEAEAAYRQAIELDPKHVGAHNNFGLLLHATGRVEEAEAAYRKAIELDPKDAGAHHNLGLLLKEAGRMEEAEAAFRKAIELDPKLALAHNSLGGLLKEAGRMEEAEAAFRKAIELDPKVAAAHNNLGVLLMEAGRLEEAEAAYRQAIELDPKDALAHNNLGLLLKEAGRLEEAEAAFRMAIELDPKHAAAHYNLGNLLRDDGRLEEAEAAYRMAVELDPEYAEARCNFGLLLMQKTDRFADAAALLKRGHELGSARGSWRYPSARWLAGAERLLALDERLAAVAAGEAEPANSVEALALADFAIARKNSPELAARLFAGALEDGAVDAQTLHRYRYNAACAAARVAADDNGEGAPEVTGEEKSAWRMQALDWLSANLADLKEQAGSDSAAARESAEAELAHWLQDPDLAALRGAAIDDLPPGEQTPWRDFWAAVEQAR